MRRRPYRQALFLAAHLALAAAAWLFVAAPIAGFLEEQRDAIAAQAAALARFQRIAEQAPRVEETEKQAAAAAGEEFLSGASEGAVSANLQTRLKAASESAGASVRSVRALPARQVDSIGYSGARMEIYGTVRAIQATLYNVEFSTPPLTITSCILRLAAAPPRPGEDEPVVEAQFDAYGAVRGKLAGE